MLGIIIRKINLALLQKNFELRKAKKLSIKYYLSGYKMALNDVRSWIEREERGEDPLN